MIILNRTLNEVSVDGVVRAVDLSEINPDIAVIHYNPLTRSGVVFNQDNSVSSLGANSFVPYERFVQVYKAESAAQITLAEAKANQRQQINSIRDTIEQSGFEYLGKQIDSDSVSVQRITVASQAAMAALQAGLPFLLEWTCQDGTTLELDGVAMLGMSPALAMFANALHVHAKTKKDLIEAATTVEAVAAIVW